MAESYLHVYERYLEPLRHQPINLLELGVKGGHSVRMWEEYFPRAEIYGIDLNPDCSQHSEDRIHITIASQDDEQVLDDLASRAGGFDVVVDDASHINLLTVESYRILFPHLRPGGFYLIEDLGMSYVDMARFSSDTSFMEGEHLINRERGVELTQTRAQLDSHFGDILYQMDMNQGLVRYVHFWSKIAILQRGAE